MLNLTELIGFGSGGQSLLLKDILSRTSLTTNLLVCLDAGDPTSYSGSGQTWYNTVPSAPTNFYLGVTGSVEASYDPVFTGTAGDLQAYFNMPSAGLFTETTAGWGDDAFVKDGYAYTLVFIAYLPGTPANSQNYHAIGNYATAPYGRSGITTARNLIFTLDPTSSAGSVSVSTTATVPTTNINFLAFSIQDVASISVFQINSTQETLNTENPQSNTNNASGASAFGRWSNDAGTQPISANTRFYGIMVWNRALSASELTTLRTALLERFPSI